MGEGGDMHFFKFLKKEIVIKLGGFVLSPKVPPYLPQKDPVL